MRKTLLLFKKINHYESKKINNRMIAGKLKKTNARNRATSERRGTRNSQQQYARPAGQ
jgi:hypothetical protein